MADLKHQGKHIDSSKLKLIFEEFKEYKTTLVLKENHDTGYYTYTSLTVNIYRIENDEEYLARKKWQENYIANIIFLRKNLYEKKILTTEKEEKELLQQLKEKYKED